jgi:hypothetical protein
MLNSGVIERPNNFTFMMIDQWSSEPYYSTWDMRNNYRSSIEDNDFVVYDKFMNVCKKNLYFFNDIILNACYNTGLEHDYDLFYRTFDFFHSYCMRENNAIALTYLRTLNEQLVGTNRERTRTLNKYFKSDLNLLILEKDALELVIKCRNIKDIAIIGSSWEECLKYRPVGFTNVDLTTCNYYIIPELCRKNNSESVTEDDLIKCEETEWIRCDRTLSTDEVAIYKLLEVVK